MFLKVFLLFCRFCFAIVLFSMGTALITTSGVFLYLSPKLPSVDSLKQVQLQMPMKIYTADKVFAAQFGEKYRTPLKYEEVPPLFIKALLAAEDARFFTHPGIDITGLIRATVELIQHGNIQSGGSTITMQVARNYLLSSEKTFLRKFNEILLSFRIEKILSKEEIFELYFNIIYMGNRAYGVEAAAKRYYGKSVDELNLSELALIAGLPKAPSTNNPLINPEAALARRNWILNRMLSLGHISKKIHDIAIALPHGAALHDEQRPVEASHVSEMVRETLFKKYDEKVINSGLSIFTTIDSHLQEIGNNAVVNGLIEYEQRHGYRGAEKNYSLIPNIKNGDINEILKKYPSYSGISAALVVSINKSDVTAQLNNNDKITIHWDQLKWAAPYINVNKKGVFPKKPRDILKIGDLIRVKKTEDGLWLLTQLPETEAALISIDPKNGAIKSLVGGFSFSRNKFNRVTQAMRQPGSSFKPFIYSAALEHGFSPASIIDDAPLELNNGYGLTWKPQNSDGEFLGSIRLREALYKSRNLVSIRLLQAISIPTARNHLTRFGFNEKQLPAEFSLALGTASTTPLSIATGYAVFANGGYKISPYFIEEIIDYNNKIIFSETPNMVCESCSIKHDHIAPRVLDERNVYMINSMLADVVSLGTAAKAKKLERFDLAGKTGTTNDQKDNWFSGFNSDLVTTVWVGFDNPQSLGNKEYGATTALPIWMNYMAKALDNKPEKIMPQPDGLVMAKVDPKTGFLVSSAQSNAVFELFKNEDLLKMESVTRAVEEHANDTPSLPSKTEKIPLPDLF